MLCTSDSNNNRCCCRGTCFVQALRSCSAVDCLDPARSMHTSTALLIVYTTGLQTAYRGLPPAGRQHTHAQTEHAETRKRQQELGRQAGRTMGRQAPHSAKRRLAVGGTHAVPQLPLRVHLWGRGSESPCQLRCHSRAREEPVGTGSRRAQPRHAAMMHISRAVQLMLALLPLTCRGACANMWSGR